MIKHTIVFYSYSLWILIICCLFLLALAAQVEYDNDATIIGSATQASPAQSAFTIPDGEDRLLVAFVTRDGNGTSTSSISFNGQNFTLKSQQQGGFAANSVELVTTIIDPSTAK